MQYTTLTGTGVTVSRLCLGTMVFGSQTSEEESLKIIRYAFDAGINFFDTANVYNQGESERIVGKAMQGIRSRVVLATKVGNRLEGNPDETGLSRRSIIAAVESSLKRLGTDYIDIYYMHQPDYRTPLEESLHAMSSLVRAGKIRYVGVSNFAAWQIADALAVSDKKNLIAPVVTQNVYNLLTRGIENELAPFLRAHKIGMTVYNPIAGGLLAGKHKPGKPASDTRFASSGMYYDRYWSDENFGAVERLTQIAAEAGMSLLELAMKWTAAQDIVTCIITGASRLEQIAQNAASLDGAPIGEETLKKCDEVWGSLAGTRFAYNR